MLRADTICELRTFTLSCKLRGHQKVISELFCAGDPYLESDAVFGVKESLVVDFVLHESTQDAENYGHPAPFYSLEYDFFLVEGNTKSEISFSADRIGKI